MTVKLLMEYHLEFLSLKGGCTGSSESIPVKNTTLFEITCHSSYVPDLDPSFLQRLTTGGKICH